MTRAGPLAFVLAVLACALLADCAHEQPRVYFSPRVEPRSQVVYCYLDVDDNTLTCFTPAEIHELLHRGDST